MFQSHGGFFEGALGGTDISSALAISASSSQPWSGETQAQIFPFLTFFSWNLTHGFLLSLVITTTITVIAIKAISCAERLSMLCFTPQFLTFGGESMNSSIAKDAEMTHRPLYGCAHICRCHTAFLSCTLSTDLKYLNLIFHLLLREEKKTFNPEP